MPRQRGSSPKCHGRRRETLRGFRSTAPSRTDSGIGVDERAAIAGAVGSIAVTLMRRRTELLREEMTAPGSELAFISKAREAARHKNIQTTARYMKAQDDRVKALLERRAQRINRVG